MKKLLITTENAEYQVIQALKLNRTKRSKSGEVFIEGIESIKQAVHANVALTRIIAADVDGLSDWGKQLIQEHETAKIIEMSRALYKNLCDKETPSEMIATAKINSVDLSNLRLSETPFVLIFDRPSDHGNFGSLVRSANSFSVDAIFVVGHAIDVYDPKVIRASLGSIFHANLVAVPSLHELEQWLAVQRQKNHLQLVGTDSSGEVSLQTHTLEKPIALILGNEAKGMSVALKNLCDYTISIPLAGAVNSLNVACAGSILLWEIYKNDRRQSPF
ncbi:MAG: RNA methyltransferase [Caldilineaceae bacterium]|jgi:TrmH family RNA methyltransferase|nr:RNA methyltransferase [Caldilineaceae bacterium]